MNRASAFTLIELLVVITIIVVLLALLTPALEKAVYQAEKVRCLSQQRLMVQSCQFYATDNKRLFPPDHVEGRGAGTSYDIWTYAYWMEGNGNFYPVGLGLLPEAGYLPKNQLGKIMHCPVMNNLGSPLAWNGALKFAGLGMDVVHDWGSGASYLFDTGRAPNSRIIIGYNYRAASFENSGKGRLSTSKVGSADLITVDFPDLRFTGLCDGSSTDADLRAFTHPDGYNRVFADGHGGFHDDTDFETAHEIQNRAPGDGGRGAMDGLPYNAAASEFIYQHRLNLDH